MKKAQSVLEYTLLVVISIVAILLAGKLWQLGGRGSSRLDWHFDKVTQRIVNGS